MSAQWKGRVYRLIIHTIAVAYPARSGTVILEVHAAGQTMKEEAIPQCANAFSAAKTSAILALPWMHSILTSGRTLRESYSLNNVRALQMPEKFSVNKSMLIALIEPHFNKFPAEWGKLSPRSFYHWRNTYALGLSSWRSRQRPKLRNSK